MHMNECKLMTMIMNECKWNEWISIVGYEKEVKGMEHHWHVKSNELEWFVITEMYMKCNECKWM